MSETRPHTDRLAEIEEDCREGLQASDQVIMRRRDYEWLIARVRELEADQRRGTFASAWSSTVTARQPQKRSAEPPCATLRSETMADRTWAERGKWLQKHDARIILDMQTHNHFVSVGDPRSAAGATCYPSRARVDSAIDVAMDDCEKQEREAAERAKAEQAAQMAPAAPWLRADAVCPACQGTGTKTTADRLTAEPAATAARARSPVAALLKQYSHNISVPIWAVLAAIDQQCADWLKDADELDVMGACASDPYTARQDALRNCASDLSGSTGE